MTHHKNSGFWSGVYVDLVSHAVVCYLFVLVKTNNVLNYDLISEYIEWYKIWVLMLEKIKE